MTLIKEGVFSSSGCATLAITLYGGELPVTVVHFFITTVKFCVEAGCSQISTNFEPRLFLTFFENRVTQIYACLIKSCLCVHHDYYSSNNRKAPKKPADYLRMRCISRCC